MFEYNETTGECTFNGMTVPVRFEQDTFILTNPYTNEETTFHNKDDLIQHLSSYVNFRRNVLPWALTTSVDDDDDDTADTQDNAHDDHARANAHDDDTHVVHGAQC